MMIAKNHAAITHDKGSGSASMSPLDRLIYSIWAVDYSMRNAGDLANLKVMHPSCLADGRSAAKVLILPRSLAAFSFSASELGSQYFELFDDVTREVRDAVLSRSA